MNAEYPRSLVPVLQGWVCPGYLVAGAAAEHVTALEAAWAGHALVPPASFTIVAVGVTRGCSFAPFKQVSSEQEQEHTAQSMWDSVRVTETVKLIYCIQEMLN